MKVGAHARSKGGACKGRREPWEGAIGNAGATSSACAIDRGARADSACKGVVCLTMGTPKEPRVLFQPFSLFTQWIFATLISH